MRSNRKVLAIPPGREERRRLHILAESGVELPLLQWTFDRPCAELEAVLANCRRERSLAAAEPTPDDETHRPASIGKGAPLAGASAAAHRAAPIERALAVLGARAAETEAGFELDGGPAAAADLIRAAAAAGARIPYPGVDPLPGSYTTGPSRLRRRVGR